MKACTFFGHRIIAEDIYNILLSEIEKLIITENVNMFYIGNQGTFDSLAKKAVFELSKKYTHINYNIVLAYRPKNSESNTTYDFSHAIYPEEVAIASPRYSIAVRNKWMIEHSDYVISYITHDFGGAAKAIDFCRKKNKRIINLATLKA